MLDRLLMNVLSRIQPVRVARTNEERTAIYRMRYRIYVDEQNERGYPHADHARREIRSPADDLPESRLYFIGSAANPTASMRVRTWGPGEIPDDVYHEYSLGRFSDIRTRVTCYTSHLMVNASVRGKAAAVALTSGALVREMRRRPVEMQIAECAPGLLPTYRRLGLRPFGGRIMSTTMGLSIPVVAIIADLEHFRRCRSPWYAPLAKLGREGKLPTREWSTLLPPFAEPGIETDPRSVRAEVAAVVAAHRVPMLESLPKESLNHLLDRSCVLRVDPGVDVFVEGFANRDLFVVLDGSLDLIMGDEVVRRIGPGEIVGEVAFFSARGRRSGTLRAATACRLLHMSMGSLRRLAARSPKDGVFVYEALARVLAERLGAAAPIRSNTHT